MCSASPPITTQSTFNSAGSRKRRRKSIGGSEGTPQLQCALCRLLRLSDALDGRELQVQAKVGDAVAVFVLLAVLGAPLANLSRFRFMSRSLGHEGIVLGARLRRGACPRGDWRLAMSEGGPHSPNTCSILLSNPVTNRTSLASAQAGRTRNGVRSRTRDSRRGLPRRALDGGNQREPRTRVQLS